jgi:hypothetical protein
MSRVAASTLAAAAIGGALALGAAPAGATTTSTMVTAGDYATTVDLQSSAPVISGTPPAAVLSQTYNYALTVTGDPTPTVTVTAGTLPSGLSMDTTGRITGFPGTTGQTTVTVTATSSAGSTSKTFTVTVQPAHSGNPLVFMNPPHSTRNGEWESNDLVETFAERYNQVLTSNLTVGGTTLGAGTRVNVYYVHADANIPVIPFTGSLAFGNPVLAVAKSTADMHATNTLLGAPGTIYDTSATQGTESTDYATASGGGVTYSLNSNSVGDAFRVITRAQ